MSTVKSPRISKSENRRHRVPSELADDILAERFLPRIARVDADEKRVNPTHDLNFFVFFHASKVKET